MKSMWEVYTVTIRVRYDSFKVEAINEWLEENTGWEPVDWQTHSINFDEVVLKVKRIKKRGDGNYD